MINRVVLVGRLTRDPELRYTPNGVAVGNFTLAINRPFASKDSEKREADFINCVVWRKPAENLATYMNKGSQIGIEGRLQSRTYEDKDGKTVFVTEVVADSVQFLESKSDQKNTQNEQYGTQSKQSGTGNPQNSTGYQSGGGSNASQGDPFDIQDDDLPF